MKKFVILLFLIVSIKTQATELDGYYVGVRGDTTQCTFDIRMSEEGEMNYSILSEVVKITEENGGKRKLRAGQIRHFYIGGALDKKFVSIKLHDNYVFLLEENDGKLKLYRHHFRAGNGGHLEMHFVIQSPFKNPSELTPIRFKKQLLKYTNEEPFFAAKLSDKSWKYDRLDELIALYNEQITE
ncbi:MAG: hypothetical protein ABJP45_15530 [Cyclobacteriaceae bacterium]